MSKKQLIEKLPKVKKDLRCFLNEEEGKIAIKSAVKLGLGILAAGLALSKFMKINESLAGSAHTSHGSHGSHASHSSHGSHGSHCHYVKVCWPF